MGSHNQIMHLPILQVQKFVEIIDPEQKQLSVLMEPYIVGLEAVTQADTPFRDLR